MHGREVTRRKNCFLDFLQGNERSRSYRVTNQYPKSSVELYDPWIVGPLRVTVRCDMVTYLIQEHFSRYLKLHL